MNPLPTHYYCPSCGHFEQIHSPLFGIDLPETACPTCHTNMKGDGFNISIESVWGTDGKKSLSFEYNISEEFRPFAKRLLKTIYPNNEIVPLGYFNKDIHTHVITVLDSGFIVLPAGQTINDYTDMHGYLEDGDLCLTGNTLKIQEHNMHRLLLLSFDTENNIVIMQRKTGIYINDIFLSDLRSFTWNDFINTRALNETEASLFRELKPKTFTEMIKIISCSHDTFKGCNLDIYDNSWDLFGILHKPEFIEYPCFTRDDVFDTALSFGLDRNDAFELSEFLRRGLITHSPKKLDKYELPEAFRKIAQQCLFLFPRSHCASFLLAYATLAYYMKQDSRSFSRLANKKK